MKSSPSADKRYRIIAVGIGIIYYALFLLCYRFTISESFTYSGLQYRELPEWCLGISILLATAPLMWLPLAIKRPSDFAVWILYLSVIMPTNIVAFMVSDLPPTEVLTLPVSLTGSFILFDISRKGNRFKLPKSGGSAFTFKFLIPTSMITLCTLTMYLSDFKFDLSISDIYHRRLSARAMLADGAISYAIALISSVFIPVAVYFAWEKRDRLYLILSIISLIAVFSFDGTKSTLLLPFALIASIFLSSNTKYKSGIWLLSFFALFVGLAIIEDLLVGTGILSTYIVRRQLAVPGQLTTYYWEYFSTNAYYFMTDSVLGYLIPLDAPSSLHKSMLIGLKYMNSLDCNANANIWASGFADFGYFGMGIVSIAAAQILKIVDGIVGEDTFVFACMCSTAIGLSWVNSSLQTSVVSHGIAGLIFALWLLPSHKFTRIIASRTPLLLKEFF